MGAVALELAAAVLAIGIATIAEIAGIIRKAEGEAVIIISVIETAADANGIIEGEITLALIHATEGTTTRMENPLIGE